MHFLVTYKCNSECPHCFLSCGSRREGKLGFSEAKKYIEEAKQIQSINYFYIEGGEPFLYSKLIKKIVQYAKENSYWVGALSNGFWAKSVEKGIEILAPLKEVGLVEIGVSTDKYHQRAIPFKYAKNAVKAAKQIGIDAYLMKTDLKQVKCRGRGAKICIGKSRPWQELTDCLENLSDPGRVHIGPEGAIHLCQGFLVGQDARQNPLRSVLEQHIKEPNIIVQQIIQGGPAQLARFAQGFGFKPKDTYVQGCQLCFEARRFLQQRFPKIIAPLENYI